MIKNYAITEIVREKKQTKMSPAELSPKKETLDFIRKFARLYQASSEEFTKPEFAAN